MKIVISNLIGVLMSVTFFLLAFQAEPVTKTLGIIFGALIAISLIVRISAQAGRDA